MATWNRFMLSYPKSIFEHSDFIIERECSQFFNKQIKGNLKLH